MSKRIKVVILGGSALASPSLFEVMGQKGARSAYDFVIFGRDLERLGLVESVSNAILQTYPELDIKIQTSTHLEIALEGADYCINQVRAGGLEGRAFDESFPRQFGIPGEETVGPGGFTNSMRGIPVTLEICRTIEKVAPKALVFNLTNPSSIIQYAIQRYTTVNAIGTCDSPVSLMESIARLVNHSTNELNFEIAGMHHFGWVAGVQYGEENCLPEVLDRVEEMPKLGTDPELIRSLGVIPSVYYKYYAHPDRILAETEGRKIRAHQLMELNKVLLADYRAWKPGEPAAMLAKRGAAWYEKIVVPALLMFAEQGSGEMVLSVKNGQTLPMLPENSIVEVQVKIENGIVTGTRGAQLPLQIQGMLAQNCAYEMQAAEAIVEMNWNKAIRALISNPLVRDFNQARGILSLVWPEKERFKFPILQFNQKAQSGPGFKVPALYYGEDLIEKFDPPEQDFVLITMEELWGLVEHRFQRKPSAVLFVRELDWYRLEAMERALPEAGVVVGLGGGVAQDAAKYAGWRRHIPVDEIVSITSVDASVTKSIAARAGGHVTYIGYIVPRNVYIDYQLIQSAPSRLNRSGVGDILCAHTALWDWRFSHEQTGEAYDLQAVAEMQDWLLRIQQEADGIREVSQAGILTVMEAFENISIICRRYGNSRPQEASDHTFAYNAEFQTGKNFLHGELVALGAWIMANLQENDPGYLSKIYEQTGILWQPKDLGLTRAEFNQTLTTLNWYQSNFGRRFSILNKRVIEPAFIDRVAAHLNFPD